MKLLNRLINRWCGPPAEDLEDTSERLKITREMVKELAGEEAATRAIMELDRMTDLCGKAGKCQQNKN